MGTESRLKALAATYLDMMQFRVSSGNRFQAVENAEEFFAPTIKAFGVFESEVKKALDREFRVHPIYPWLSERPGLAGTRMAVVVAIIGNPWRFPGQQCTEGHYHPSRPGLSVGAPCPELGADEIDEETGEITEGKSCPGIMLPPRPHTGTRSLWHFGGFIPGDNGRLLRHRKGEQSHWNTKLRTQFLMPDGIADQVVKHRTPIYRDIYDVVKARKIAEGRTAGDSHRIARIVVSKAVLGDMLAEWKRLGGSSIIRMGNDSRAGDSPSEAA